MDTMKTARSIVQAVCDGGSSVDAVMYEKEANATYGALNGMDGDPVAVLLAFSDEALADSLNAIAKRAGQLVILPGAVRFP